jgi:hypothetical protein
MTLKPRSKILPTHEAIAVRAYEIYLRETRAGDHSLEHWLRAEAELENQLARRQKARAAKRHDQLQPALPVFASPIDAWCSGFEEPDKSARIRRRATSLV